MATKSQEVFKAAEEAGNFLRGLRGLLAVEEVLRNAGTMLQASEEAEKARVAATKARDEALKRQEEAENAANDAEKAVEEMLSSAKAEAAKIGTDAEEAALIVVRQAEAEAAARRAEAAGDVEDCERVIRVSRDTIAALNKEIAIKEQRLDLLNTEINEIRKKLGG